jgi:hypothetical protein
MGFGLDPAVHDDHPFPVGISSAQEVKKDKAMLAARASIGVELVIAIAAFFVMMVFVATINFWYGRKIE